MTLVTVESKVTRGGRLEQTLQPVTLDFLEQEITVAELIRRTVTEQVRQLQARSEGSAALARQYGDQRDAGSDLLDASREVQRAQEAFSQGHFMILIDGSPASDLQQTLTFAPGVSIRFVRLTPLVGG